MKGSLVEVFRRLRQSEHCYDLKNGGWDGEHVGLEDRESKVLKSEGEVSLNMLRSDCIGLFP